MKTLHDIVTLAGWRVLPFWLLFLPAIVFAAEPAKEQPGRDPLSCELVIEGRPVEKIVLKDEQGRLKEIDHPGAKVFLPPGRYWIQEIDVKWDDSGDVFRDRDVNWILLVPYNACWLKVGIPQAPKLTVWRRGKLLTMDYNLRESDSIFSFARGNPPQVSIYQDDQKITSGSFQYG